MWFTVSVIVIHVLGTATAYPKRKRFVQYERVNDPFNKNPTLWTYGDMLGTVFYSLTCWFLIWIWYLALKIDALDTSKWWISKSSKF